MTTLPDEQYPLEYTQVASSRDEKTEIIRNFLSEEDIRYEDGIPVNYSKFLYLFGAANTGKLYILKEVAQELFGNEWESKIYLRVDDGQRYPYKLHAHKVESSKKVIIVTDKRIHWKKWRELYPTTKTFMFEGVEVVPNPQGIATIQWTNLFSELPVIRRDVQTEIDQVIRSFFQQENLSPLIAERLVTRLGESTRTYHRNIVDALLRSDVTTTLP